jgi:hypothetical protein
MDSQYAQPGLEVVPQEHNPSFPQAAPFSGLDEKQVYVPHERDLFVRTYQEDTSKYRSTGSRGGGDDEKQVVSSPSSEARRKRKKIIIICVVAAVVIIGAVAGGVAGALSPRKNSLDGGNSRYGRVVGIKIISGG